jgi:hypothetical protein
VSRSYASRYTDFQMRPFWGFRHPMRRAGRCLPPLRQEMGTWHAYLEVGCVGGGGGAPQVAQFDGKSEDKKAVQKTVPKHT